MKPLSLCFVFRALVVETASEWGAWVSPETSYNRLSEKAEDNGNLFFPFTSQEENSEQHHRIENR